MYSLARSNCEVKKWHFHNIYHKNHNFPKPVCFSALQRLLRLLFQSLFSPNSLPPPPPYWIGWVMWNIRKILYPSPFFLANCCKFCPAARLPLNLLPIASVCPTRFSTVTGWIRIAAFVRRFCFFCNALKPLYVFRAWNFSMLSSRQASLWVSWNFEWIYC